MVIFESRISETFQLVNTFKGLSRHERKLKEEMAKRNKKDVERYVSQIPDREVESLFKTRALFSMFLYLPLKIDIVVPK